MRHCARQFLAQVAAGEQFFYRVHVEGERLTLAVTPDGRGRYDVVDLRGAQNRDPTPRAARRVARWVGQLRPDQRAGGLTRGRLAGRGRRSRTSTAASPKS